MSKKKMRKRKECTTDNDIGYDGVKMMSEALKANSTLKELDLSCEEEEKGKEK